MYKSRIGYDLNVRILTCLLYQSFIIYTWQYGIKSPVEEM